MTSRLFLLLCLAFSGESKADVVTTRPFRGVRFTTRSEIAPRPLKMHVVEVDLRQRGLRFKLTEPGGTLDTVRESTLDFLNRQQAQVAINCHFMVPYPTTNTDVEVVGLAVSNGHLFSPFEPEPVGIGYADQSYAILPYGPALNIGRANHVRVVHYEYPRPCYARVVERARLWNTVSGSAQIVTDGVKSIPTYKDSADGLKPLNGYYAGNSWYDRLRARTAIGFTADARTLVLFTVDETGGSFGMTVGEVADVLINDFHVYQALNLDGGGSTTMVLQDTATGLGKIVNSPSDNPLGRAVGSNLAVFARPAREEEGTSDRDPFSK